MHIQGIKLKKGQEPQRSSLYEIKEERVIHFKEKKSAENVDIEFVLTGKQKGFYAEEYRPATIAEEGAKLIDITAFIIDESAEKCKWYVYDVKKDVGGEDDIFHLYEQWQDGVKYLKKSVLEYLEDYQMEEHVGVMTRHFDEERISKAISLRENKIAEIKELAYKSLAGRKMLPEKPKLEAEKKLLTDVLNRKFFYKERNTLQCYNFDVVILTERNQDDFIGCLTVEMC